MSTFDTHTHAHFQFLDILRLKTYFCILNVSVAVNNSDSTINLLDAISYNLRSDIYRSSSQDNTNGSVAKKNRTMSQKEVRRASHGFLPAPDCWGDDIYHWPLHCRVAAILRHRGDCGGLHCHGNIGRRNSYGSVSLLISFKKNLILLYLGESINYEHFAICALPLPGCICTLM